MLQRWINRLLPWLGLGALFLPALTASVPLLTPQRWSAANLSWTAARAVLRPAPAAPGQATPPARPSLFRLLHQAAAFRSSLSRQTGAGATLPRAFRFALLIPAMVIVSTICMLLLLGLSWLPRRWPGLAAASVGLVAGAYGILASWYLTRTLRTEVANALQRTQSRFGWAGLRQMSAALAGQTGLSPEFGLLAMVMIFTVYLLLPPERGC